MITGYKSYKVEIRNEKLLTGDGPARPETAIITFYDDESQKTGEISLRAVSAAYIYDLIKQGKDINLDNCYISEFSLQTYRNLHGIEKRGLVPLRGFSARNAFIESQGTNDFSYALFSDGEVSFEGAHFAKGDVSFRGSVFGKGNVIFSNTLFREGNVEFTKSTFGDGDFLFKNAIVNNGIKDFQDIQFGNGEVSFANTEFNSGEILFINSRFGTGRFDFKIARISGGKIDFHYSIFGEGEILFERTEFGNSRVDFRTVDFGAGRINFNRSVFGNGDLNFEGSSCNSGKMQFKKAVMGSGTKNLSLMEMNDTEVSFERTDFGTGAVSFNESEFRTLSLKSCHLNNYFDLRLKNAGLLDLSDTIARDIIDLEPYDFPVSIKTIDISGMRLIGKLYISWKLNKCRSSIISQEGTTLLQKAEQFRILKENFNSTGKYEDEDNAYVMFKRFEAKSWFTVQKERGGLRKFLSNFVYGFQWLVFDKIGLYATSPARVLTSVILIWLFFGSVFFTMDATGLGKTVSSVGNPDNLTTLLQSFYHSAITFFTIGYGDVYPMGWSRVISGIEGFIGVFMMSYFTVAFVRKVQR